MSTPNGIIEKFNNLEAGEEVIFEIIGEDHPRASDVEPERLGSEQGPIVIKSVAQSKLETEDDRPAQFTIDGEWATGPAKGDDVTIHGWLVADVRPA